MDVERERAWARTDEHDARALDPAVALGGAHGGAADARVEEAQLAVARRRGEEGARGREGEGLDGVGVPREGEAGRFGRGEVPELCVV